MKFKKLTGNQTFELADYVKEYLNANNGMKIDLYLGCDSQSRGLLTTYATTLVFHVATTGCHVVYKKDTMPVIKDMWSRLWKETEFSVETALYLREAGVEIDTIDLDYNIDPLHNSNRLVKTAVGYIESLDFKARVKPELLPAAYAADGIVN